LKALHLTGYFFPEYSGTTTRLYNIVSRLPFQVQIITSDRTGAGNIIPEKEEQIGNISVNRIPLASGGLLQAIPVLRYAHTLYRRPSILAKYASGQQFDIIHAHNSLVYGEAAKQLSAKSGKPFILELHGLSQESSAGPLGSIKARYIERVDKKLLSDCHHIITLTQSLKEWIHSYHGLPESKITVVPNGADVEQFSPGNGKKRNAENLREKFGIGGKIVMYAGNMDKINGIEDLGKVIPDIIQERPDVCFVFIGQRPRGRRFTLLAEDYPQNVKFLPMVPYEEMPAYYQMCDVFVVPRPSTISSETLTPLKLLEVMAMGRPVLGSNVGGIAEVVKDGENGYLFEKENMESFRKVLLAVLDTDNTQIGNNARDTIIKSYTWDNSVKVLQKVYQDLG